MLTGCFSCTKEFADRYRKMDCWRGETFGEMLRERAGRQGGRTAVTEGGKKLSYAELDDRADRLAAGFQKLGLRQGDRVIIQLPNIIEFFEVCFALFRLGAVPVFALPSHRSSEICYFCGFTEAVAYIIPDTHMGFDYRSLAEEIKNTVPALRHVIVAGDAGNFIPLAELYTDAIIRPPEINPSDIAFLLLSGGSTGLPKLIPRTHDDYIYCLRINSEICRLNQDSVYLTVLPVAHNYPLSSPGAFGTLYAGGRVVLAAAPSPEEAFPLIEQERVTITSLVPPLALIWLEAAASCRYDLSSLKILQVGGAKFSEEAARRIRPVFGCTLQQSFGMAEGLVNCTRLDDPEDMIVGTQGKPSSPYDEVKVVNENDSAVPPGQVGQLLARGPCTIRGYYKADEYNKKVFTSDGFFRTGDLVSVNKSGYIVVEGRAKDQINRGGEKIAAEEVENHLLAHPKVLDAAVVSMPDTFLGERSCAFVISRSRTSDAADLKNFLKGRGLAAFKIPDRIEFISDFPYTPLGKVSKKALRKMIAEKVSKLKAKE